MQAIILAAGMGRRLKNLTENNTKCMVRVNGVSLIERMLSQLDNRGLTKIVIVTGFKGEKLKTYVETLHYETPLVFLDNPNYDKTNNIYSLSIAKEYLQKEDTLLFESDIIFEDCVLDLLIQDKRETLALVDKYEPWMDGTCLRLDEEDRIIDFISGKNFDFNNTAGCYKTVNIYKFSKHFSAMYYIPFLEAYQRALGENEYYEQVLKVIASLDDAEIRGKRLDGQKWYEIDDIQDLDIAETIFASSDDRVARMEDRYGGYWRFSDILDFCYLVNPYYPPQKMKDEIRASFDTLLTEYPSGMEVNSLLAGKNFGVDADNIVVGNGAAELIKSLMSNIEGNMGIVRPTFEEYPNRYKEEDTVVFHSNNDDCTYSEMDLIEFFDDKDIQSLIVINPDNPSGNYISKNGLNRLIEWGGRKGIYIIIDESFVDFADEDYGSLIEQGILEENPHLFVMKSISKSYGVPGLRLGILASGNTEMISWIKKDVSIWNINSFAEFYMQIAEKYKDEYKQGLKKFKEERKVFYKELSNIKDIRVIPSEANYFMVELLNGIKASKVTENLLSNANILIKDLSDKLCGKQYIRIAIRNHNDNMLLVRAMKKILEDQF